MGRVTGKNFLQRCKKESVWRRPDGKMVTSLPCDLTVTRLTNGTYRCYDCPAGGESWHCAELEDMILHVADHMLAGCRVPVDRVFRLVDALGR